MSYHIGLQVLRAKIRGFQATGSTISSRITRSERDRRNRLWNEKRALGNHCRAHLVAYGLLRGVPYSRIERCAPSNRLNPQVVLDIMLIHGGGRRRTPNIDEVERLLTVTSALAPSACPMHPATVEASPPAAPEGAR